MSVALWTYTFVNRLGFVVLRGLIHGISSRGLAEFRGRKTPVIDDITALFPWTNG
ncbi:MAG: hypothetical protein ACLP9L_33555 [Thermoguttaceae bacterium]